MADPKKHASPHVCYHKKFGGFRSNLMDVGRALKKIGDAGAPPPCDRALLTS